MIHIGHTMATPEMPVLQAAKLFDSLGFDAMEIICMTRAEQGDRHSPAAGDAPIPTFEWGKTELQSMADRAWQLGAPIRTITQYTKTFNSDDPQQRRQSIDTIRQFIEMAEICGAQYVRVHGGQDGFGQVSWPRAVDALGQLAQTAATHHVLLVLENHPGTLTVTGEATARMARQVNSPHLKILYDPANVIAHSDEPWQQTWELQKDLIAYVHVKDFRMTGGKHIACPVGEGCVPWEAIVRLLVENDYRGPLSYEYERKWNRQQLPPASIGLRQSMDHIKYCLTQSASKEQV